MLERSPRLFGLLSCGVYVVGVRAGDHRNAFTAAWVMQASFKPPLLTLSINPAHRSFKLLQIGGVCSVNVLGQQQIGLARHFGQAGLADKMAGHRWRTAVTGAPILQDCLAYFDCQVVRYADAGDHQLAICEVVAGARLHEGAPLLYRQTGDLDGSQALY